MNIYSITFIYMLFILISKRTVCTLSTEGTARDNSFLHQDVERCVGHLLLAVTGRLLTGPANDRLPHYRGYLTVP